MAVVGKSPCERAEDGDAPHRAGGTSDATHMGTRACLGDVCTSITRHSGRGAEIVLVGATLAIEGVRSETVGMQTDKTSENEALSQ